MEPVKGIINKLMQDLISGKFKHGSDLIRQWPGAVGKKNARHTKIVSLKGGNLSVNVDSPVRLFNLRLKRCEILKNLTKVTGDNSIKNIYFRIGAVD